MKTSVAASLHRVNDRWLLCTKPLASGACKRPGTSRGAKPVLSLSPGPLHAPLACMLLAVLYCAILTWGSTAAEASERPVKRMQLRVSANGRYFVDQDGKPFFYLGDTAWLLFQRLDRQEVDEYLKDRAAKGFTVIQAYVLRGLEARHPDGASSLIGEKPLIDRDPTRPNEAFFKNVDYVI